MKEERKKEARKNVNATMLLLHRQGDLVVVRVYAPISET